MTDDKESADLKAESKQAKKKPAAKKSAAKKAAKKVAVDAAEKVAKSAKKVAKKAAKKVAKKAAKKAVKKGAKKAAKKSVKKVEAEQWELNLSSGQAEYEAELAERAARRAAEEAVAAAKIAREAAEKAARMAEEAALKSIKKSSVAVEEPEKKVRKIGRVEGNGPTRRGRKRELEGSHQGGETKGKPSEPTTEKKLRIIEEGREEARGNSGSREKKKEGSEGSEDVFVVKREEMPPPPEVPSEIDLNEFRQLSLTKLHDEVLRLPVRVPSQMVRPQLVFTVVSCYAKHGTRVTVEGIFQMAGGNFGMLRDETRSFRNSADDIHVAARLIDEYGIRPGQKLKVLVREGRTRDQNLSATEVLEIEGIPVEEYHKPANFDSLTSLFPEERFILEGDEEDGGGLATRVVDLVAPLGKGQRGLIVAPPRGGKTILLKQIARSIQRNAPEAELLVLLLDERPEEVTDFEEMVGQNVYASTFDEPSKRHAEVASLVLERARRLVEQKKDVVILLDSLTRLARGYNNASRGGPIGSGGVNPAAITETRKFFGAARNIEEGGSLTILATCLVETESRMDDVIFEELKGTGNMEIRLDQELAEQRIYPAIHIPQSGTRNDDRLYHPDELPRVQEIRRHLASLPIGEAIQTLLRNLGRTKTNTELLLKGMR